MQSATATSQVPLTCKFYKTTTSSAAEYKKNQRRLYSSYFTMLERLPRRTSFLIKSSLSVRNVDVRKGEPTNQVKDGVVIVDHGSRRQESNLMLNDFVAMFKSRTGYQIVEPAHMELAEPAIKDAFRRCVQQGANHVIVSPFFLSPGRHWYKDIPALVAEAAGEHSGISYIITAPLGLHELMVIYNSGHPPTELWRNSGHLPTKLRPTSRSIASTQLCNNNSLWSSSLQHLTST